MSRRQRVLALAKRMLGEARAVLEAARGAGVCGAACAKAAARLEAVASGAELKQLALDRDRHAFRGFVADVGRDRREARLRCQNGEPDGWPSCAAALLDGDAFALVYEYDSYGTTTQRVNLDAGEIVFEEAEEERKLSFDPGRCVRNYGAPGLGGMPVLAKRATASSALAGGKHDPANAIDGDLTTAWCEGRPGPGAGEWLELSWDSPSRVEAIRLFPGYGKSRALFQANARAKRIRLTFSDGHAVEADLEDVPAHQEINTAGPPAPATSPSAEPVLWSAAVTSVRIEIVDAIPGLKYPDLCLSEVGFLRQPWER